MKMFGMSGDRWVVRGVVMAMDKPTLGALLPVVGVALLIRTQPDIDISAIANEKTQFKRNACSPPNQLDTSDDRSKFSFSDSGKKVIHT